MEPYAAVQIAQPASGPRVHGGVKTPAMEGYRRGSTAMVGYMRGNLSKLKPVSYSKLVRKL